MKWGDALNVMRWGDAPNVMRWGDAHNVMRWGDAHDVMRFGDAPFVIRWGDATYVMKWDRILPSHVAAGYSVSHMHFTMIRVQNIMTTLFVCLCRFLHDK